MLDCLLESEWNLKKKMRGNKGTFPFFSFLNPYLILRLHLVKNSLIKKYERRNMTLQKNRDNVWQFIWNSNSLSFWSYCKKTIKKLFYFVMKICSWFRKFYSENFGIYYAYIICFIIFLFFSFRCLKKGRQARRAVQPSPGQR